MDSSRPALAPNLTVQAEGLGVRYRIYGRPGDRLKQMLARRGKAYFRELWAVRDVSFSVEKGTTFGIIGPNGSGKSTVLKVVAGLLTPATGRVVRAGRLSALLELGAGFHGEYSGRDNVFMNAAMLGLSKEEIEEAYPRIVEFAELEGFMDQPVKTYSSGMYVRLAFAVAAHIDPDVLVVDEALAVGDAVFQHRCMRKIKELQNRGATILLVTHDMNAVSGFCGQAMWLDNGQTRMIGAPEAVVKQYLAWAYARQDRELQMESVAAGGATTLRYGNGKARLRRYEALGPDGRSINVLRAGKVYSFELEAEYLAAVAEPILGFQIRDRYGNEVFSMNTIQSDLTVPAVQAGGVLGARFRFRWPELAEATYSFSPSAAEGTQASHQILDWIEGAMYLQSVPQRFVLGLFRVEGVEAELFQPSS